MWSGVWPPSNHGGIDPPARAFWPFVPRPAVLPLPAAMPRPTRVRSVRDPSAGRRSCNFIVYSWAASASLLPVSLAARPRPRGASSATSSTDTRKRTWRTMPRVASLSGTMLVEPIPCKPSALIVARLRAMWLIVDLVWVTRSLPAIDRLHGRCRLARDAADELHTTPGRELLGRMKATKRLDRRAGHVDRVGRAVDLREDVADAGRLEDRAHRATGDDTGTLGRRLQHHLAGRELDVDLVRDRRPDHRDLDDVLLRVLDALPDRLGDFARLAESGTDVALAVTHDDDRAEAEAPAALDDLRDAVDLDDAL